MADEFTEITNISWGQKIASSFTGIIFGLIFFVAAFFLLTWNEGRSVHRIRTLDEGQNSVIAVSPDRVDPNNNGKLIYFSAQATTNDVLSDAMFGVHENALKLGRVVEMYQWKESSTTRSQKNLGGSTTQVTTVSYTKEWSDKPINSSGFKHPEDHQNPTSMPYQSQLFTAENISIGAFKPSSAYVGQMNAFVPYPLTDQAVAGMSDQLKGYFKLYGTDYYYGDPANPQIGAFHVHYNIIRPMILSVIGKQNNASLEPYSTRNGSIQLLEAGTVGADDMFSDAKTSNSFITWLVRFGGFFLMWLGARLVFGPIAALGDVVPFIGNLLGAGIGLITGIASLVLSTITIAIAWIFYRPLIGGGLIIFAAILLFGGVRFFRKAKSGLKANLAQSTLSSPG